MVGKAGEFAGPFCFCGQLTVDEGCCNLLATEETGYEWERDLRPAAVLGGSLMIGLIVGGWLLGAEIKETKLSDRYVTVKGLVERTVKSDSAIWPVTFKESGNDLQQVYAKSEEDRGAILKFFAAQGIATQEISVGQIQVTDKQANEYGGNNNNGPRYIVQQTVTVSSNDVDKIARAGQKTAQLLQAGIILIGGYGQGIRYVFNGLNALKPDMITEATKNARCVGGPVRGGLREPGGIDTVGEPRGVFDLGGKCGEWGRSG